MKEIEKETIDGRTVSIIKNDSVTDTIVFCNAISDDWKSIAENCNALGCPPFHLVLISGLNWDEDLSPCLLRRCICPGIRFCQCEGPQPLARGKQWQIFPFLFLRAVLQYRSAAERGMR